MTLTRQVASGLVALPLLVAPALAHDHGLPNWITKHFSWCCGENDCARIGMNAVEVLPEGVRIKSTGEVILHKDVKQSRDGEWWRCHITGNDKKTRCLFAPGVS